MQIRRAIPDEARLLSAIAREAKGRWNYSAAQLEAWQDDLTITPQSVEAESTFVAVEAMQVAGFYQLRFPIASDEPPELEHLWIKGSAMRQGHGRTLVEHSLLLARARGYSAISIDADPNAEGFYLACGAQKVGEIAAPISGQPQRIRPQLILGSLSFIPVNYK